MDQDESIQERLNSLEHGLQKAAEKVSAWSKGAKKREETWWWNEGVAKVIKRKKRGIRNGGKTEAKRIWRCIRC